jgi:hypothetical protein
MQGMHGRCSDLGVDMKNKDHTNVHRIVHAYWSLRAQGNLVVASVLSFSCDRIRYDMMPQTPRIASVRSSMLNKSNQRVRCNLGEHQLGSEGASSGRMPSVR